MAVLGWGQGDGGTDPDPDLQAPTFVATCELLLIRES